MRALRWLVVAGLTTWLGLGLWYSARGFDRFRDVRARAASPVVGLPLRAAVLVTELRRVLPERPASAGERWLVVLPRDVPPLDRSYIRMQLAYLAYPAPVDVVITDAVPPLRGYAAVVTAGGLDLPARWVLSVEHGRFRRYDRRSS